MPELVRGHVPDPGGASGARDRVLDALLADPPAALDEQPRLAQPGETVSDPRHTRSVALLAGPIFGELPASDRGPLGEVTLVMLDMRAAQIGDRRDL